MSEKEKMAEELLNRSVNNVNSKPGVLKGWGKTFHLFFDDIKVGYLVKVGMDGKVEKVTKVNKKSVAATTSVYDTPATLKALMDGKMDPMEAIAEGKVKAEGTIPEMTKVSVAMGP